MLCRYNIFTNVDVFVLGGFLARLYLTQLKSPSSVLIAIAVF